MNSSKVSFSYLGLCAYSYRYHDDVIVIDEPCEIRVEDLLIMIGQAMQSKKELGPNGYWKPDPNTPPPVTTKVMDALLRPGFADEFNKTYIESVKRRKVKDDEELPSL